VTSGKGGERLGDRLTPGEVALEYMLMSLRTSEGLDLDRHASMAGRGIPESRIAALGELGLVSCAKGRLKTTPAGRLVLNGILKDLASD
jgi:oxygen-independent coproporphyrinogen-3 oxidase